MNLVDRIKGILIEPRNEWTKIAAEPATAQSLYTGWIMILAAIGPLALLVALGSARIAIAQYVMSLIITFVLALIVDALAPTFGGTKDFVASLKLIAYSYTVVWLAGVFLLLGLGGGIISLIAWIYALYTFFLGAPVLRKSSAEKAVPFTLVVVFCLIVLLTLARFVVGGMLVAPHVGSGVSMQLR
jgi:Yip1-like protein